MERQVVITPAGVDRQYRISRSRSAWPLLRMWIERDLRARYRQSALRAGWAVVQPAAMLVTYGWVFTSVLRVDQEDLPYLSFAWAGLVAYSFVQQSLGAGVGSLSDSGFLISKVYFPRQVLPLSVVGVATADMVVAFAILVVLSWVQIGAPSVHLLGALVALGVLVVWTAALTVIAAALTVFRRDLRHAMPLLLRVLFIVSPVFYSVDLLEGRARTLIRLNPLTTAMEAVRDGVLRHRWPAWWDLGGQAVAAVVLFAVATAVVHRAELTMSDRV